MVRLPRRTKLGSSSSLILTTTMMGFSPLLSETQKLADAYARRGRRAPHPSRAETGVLPGILALRAFSGSDFREASPDAF